MKTQKRGRLQLYLPFVAFRGFGLLVRARGDALGFGRGRFSIGVPVLDKEPLHEVRAPQKSKIEVEPERSYAPME